MRPSLILASAAVASCWVMPADLEDGFYTVSLPDSDSGGGRSEAALVRRDERLPPAFTIDMPDEAQPWTDAEVVPEVHSPAEEPPQRGRRHRDEIPVPVTRSDCMVYPRALPSHAYQQTRVALEAYCARYLVPGRTAHLAVARNGTVAAFVCNMRKKPLVCSTRELEWIERHYLDVDCGPLMAGQAYSKKRAKWYGRAALGMDICPLNTPWASKPRIREQVWHGMPQNECAADCNNCDGGCQTPTERKDGGIHRRAGGYTDGREEE